MSNLTTDRERRMAAELTEIIYSISRAANTLLEFDIFMCLTGRPEKTCPPLRGVEERCQELRDAAVQLTQHVTVDPALRSLPMQLSLGIDQVSEGMRILAGYQQVSPGEIERAAGLVRTGYNSIDKVLRTVVETAAVPVDMFLPKRAPIYRQYSQLLESLAERFTERLAAHAAH